MEFLNYSKVGEIRGKPLSVFSQPSAMGDVLYRSAPSASGTGSLLSGRMMILFRKKKFVLEIFLDQLRVVKFYDTRGVNRGRCSATFSHVFLFCKRSNGY